MMRVDTINLKNKIKPCADLIVEQLKSTLPSLLKTRSQEIKEWLSQQIIALKQNNNSIDDFVKQKKNYEYVEKNIQKYKDRLGVVSSQIITLKNHKFEIKKEDDQLIIDVIQSIVPLLSRTGSGS